MTIIVLPEAADEFEEAAGCYEDQLPGLGGRFRNEVDAHIRWIVQNPELPRLRPGDYRRVNLKVFPYYVAYLSRGNVLWILAIAHGHRRPDYWISRRVKVDLP